MGKKNARKLTELEIWAIKANELGISYGRLQMMETCIKTSERYRMRMIKKFAEANDDFLEKHIFFC